MNADDPVMNPETVQSPTPAQPDQAPVSVYGSVYSWAYDGANYNVQGDTIFCVNRHRIVAQSERERLQSDWQGAVATTSGLAFPCSNVQYHFFLGNLRTGHLR